MRSLPVSVVIPSYNRKEMLVRAIDSVLCQSRSCREIIVIDDGSTDGTAEMMQQWGQRESHLVLVSQENKGPAAARNAGIRVAGSRYIAFLDSDDHWKKKKLEIQFDSIDRSDFLVSHTRERWLRRGEHLNQKKIHIPRHGFIFDHCLQLCAVGMSTVMVKKSLFSKVGLFDETYRCCEDYDFWLRVSSHYPFLLIDSPLTVKEGGREDQVSAQYRIGMDELRITSIHKLLNSGVLLSEGQRSLARRELMRKLEIFGEGCLKHGRKAKGEIYLKLLAEYRKEGEITE